MSTLTVAFRLDNVLADMTSVELASAAAPYYGVKYNSTVVVPHETAMTRLSTGVYSYTWTDPADDLTYLYSIRYVFDAVTYYKTGTLLGPASAAGEPITLAEMKLWLRVDHDEDNSLISSLIAAARKYCEESTRRKYIIQTVVEAMDGFPCDGVIRPRYSPLYAVTNIAYVDSAGAEQTLSPTLYRVDTANEPGRIVPAYGQSWPGTLDITNAVSLTYQAGYGATPPYVPDGLQTAIKLLVAHWYENREAAQEKPLSEAPLAVARLLRLFQVSE